MTSLSRQPEPSRMLLRERLGPTLFGSSALFDHAFPLVAHEIVAMGRISTFITTNSRQDAPTLPVFGPHDPNNAGRTAHPVRRPSIPVSGTSSTRGRHFAAATDSAAGGMPQRHPELPHTDRPGAADRLTR